MIRSLIMNPFLESYGLTANVFRDMLVEHNILFSGSAALALYLQQKGVADNFVPNDIDLWVNDANQTHVFLEYFLERGYHLVRLFRQNDQYMERLNHIQRIFTFEHPQLHKKIQLILVDYSNLLDYIVQQFDLSICMTWWNGLENTFETLYPALTDRKQMFIQRSFLSNIDQRRAEERIQKYVQRGFEVVSEPPVCVYEGDARSEEELSKLSLRAFDVWQYDEVDGREHLEQSRWNILIRVGENWYSFERKALGKYMEEHTHFHPRLGSWYDTPYRHTLSHDALFAIYFMDFSIYRLVDPFVIEMNGASRTIYTMEAYSVADWNRGVPSHVYEHEQGIFLSHPRDQEEDPVESDDEKYDSEIVMLLSDELDADLSLPFRPISDEVSDEVLPFDDDFINRLVNAPLQPSEQELHQAFQQWIQNAIQNDSM